LRVLVITPDFPPDVGGIQELMGSLVRSLPAAEVRVLALGQAGAEEYDRTAEVEVRRSASTEMDRRLAALRLNARSLVEARRFRPDVILSGHIVASIGAVLLRKALGVPFVQYVHADEFRVRPRLAALAVRSADATIAVSRYTRDMALAAGADPARVRVIPPGIELPPEVDVPREGPPTLVTVATLKFSRKGHDVIARALPLVRERVPDARWIVVGDGPLRGALEEAIAANGIGDAVELRGRVDDAERDRILERADVFCMPSRVPEGGDVGGEGFGIVYLEAAARGVPSIAGEVAGARDAVVNGETGLLVDPTDHVAVAGAIAELLADPERAHRMGTAARRFAESHAWPLIAARVEEVLRGVAR